MFVILLPGFYGLAALPGSLPRPGEIPYPGDILGCTYKNHWGAHLELQSATAYVAGDTLRFVGYLEGLIPLVTAVLT